MTLRRMDNVGIVVDDLAAAVAFFTELGLDLEGEMPVEGPWVDRTVGLDGVRVDIAMMRTPDGHSRLELTKFHTPAAFSAEPKKRAGERAGHPPWLRAHRRGGPVREPLPAVLPAALRA